MLLLNGVLISEVEATLPATDRALTHGLGLYETLKLVDGVPVFFEEHVDRLVQGIAALGLEKHIDRPELAEQICRVSEANGV
ncbi:MAG TPA: aminotransferase class IV, partial [Thermoleophilia bacterium]|nr:aminotransferase class IV [Thermoleophilia bacterium]